jgi:hypothetical protein
VIEEGFAIPQGAVLLTVLLNGSQTFRCNILGHTVCSVARQVSDRRIIELVVAAGMVHYFFSSL